MKYTIYSFLFAFLLIGNVNAEVYIWECKYHNGDNIYGIYKLDLSESKVGTLYPREYDKLKNNINNWEKLNWTPMVLFNYDKDNNKLFYDNFSYDLNNLKYYRKFSNETFTHNCNILNK